ncbi:MAG: hypothetical protein A3I66_09275 [Burkholderiales bacterium RIFCSPLOWO2_02_FULL_57_36]|nr:MAG: hypothetical protein A3I66_09275 [Burkholderiales bacterium RIFCSPLOWO2_02_FULL_57_36]
MTKRANGKSSVSIDAAIRAQVDAAKGGSVFSPADFAGLGSRAAVDKVLSRLTASGELRRIARGLYDRSENLSPLPSVEETARALAGKSNMRLQPCGAYAATLLGLSDQMPLKLVFLTEGATRSLWIGGRQIVLRPTTRRNMATAGRISGLVIQALRHLKQPNVGESVLRHLHARLSSDEKAVLLEDAAFAPAWIAAIMRRIANAMTPAM